MLYFSHWFGMCYTKSCWSKKAKLEKLVELGSDKIEGELNVVNIMNDLRNLKIMLKHSIMTKEVKRKIKLTGKNIIDLDTSSDDDCGGECDSGHGDEERENPANALTQFVNDNIDLGIVSRSKSAEKVRVKEQKWKRSQSIVHKHQQSSQEKPGDASLI